MPASAPALAMLKKAHLGRTHAWGLQDLLVLQQNRVKGGWGETSGGTWAWNLGPGETRELLLARERPLGARACASPGPR